MAYSNYAAYKTSIDVASQIIPIGNSTSISISSRYVDLWTGAYPIAGAVPTTATALTSATQGAIPFSNGGSGRLVVPTMMMSGYPGTYILCDRLSHQGGLSAITTGAQTTNLPTAALTRYTSGTGVFAALSIYTAIGNTATTASVSYTNEAGTSGRTSPVTLFGSSGWSQQYRFLPLPLQSGDLGVQQVASVTIAASTGTAGNFGVVLFKPLMAISIPLSGYSASWDFLSGNGIGGLPEIVDDACLFWLMIPFTSNAAGVGLIKFDEC